MEAENIKTHIIKINLPGGIVPAGELLDILKVAHQAGVTGVRFGNRQQLILPVPETALEDVKNDLLIADFDYEIDTDEYPNMVSSYVTEDIIYNATWVTEGVYKDIIDLFNFKPRLKINLADNSQTFVPLFTGNLNFISSDVSNYWYLHVRFPKTNIMFCWPSLIYSEDIPGISKIIETEILTNRALFYDQPLIDGNLLYQNVDAKSSIPVQLYTGLLQLPDFDLPFYEGFNRYGNNKLWLGIYRRDEIFPVAFLKDICELCLQTRIGQLYTTPWKSIVIKGISQTARSLWGNILNQYRINVRHSATELNWQTEDLCNEGLDLKRQLVRELEDADTRTFGLSFAIKTKPKSGLFGSVLICKQRGKQVFDILHTRNFNPNSKDFVTFKKGIEQQNLNSFLIQLCHQFYQMQGSKNNQHIRENKTYALPVNLFSKQVHQCSSCLTIYNELYGDDINHIVAGINFNDIEHYTCPTCGAPKTSFVLVNEPIFVSF